MVVALISRKISIKDGSQEGVVCKRFGHDNRHKTRTKELLEEWKWVFKKHGPIMRREKTEEMWV